MENCFTFSLPYPNRDMSITIRCINNIPWFDEHEISKLLGYASVAGLYSHEAYTLSNKSLPENIELISAKRLEYILTSIDEEYSGDNFPYWKEEKWLKNIVIPSSWEMVQKETEEASLKYEIDILLKILGSYKIDVSTDIKDARLITNMKNKTLKKCKEVLTGLLKEL